MNYHHFPRPDLARQYAAAMQGKVLFNDAPNGLFLTGPRRTGKSTFLQNDLAPELERQGVLVLYVDLWANANREPGALIANTIGDALEAQRGLLHKAAKATGLESVTFGGIRLDPHKIGQKDGETLHTALKALLKAAKKPIAFIIDEAQHALTTEAGENAMMALKSARDQLNGPGKVELMLVMSGSDRDKLMRLVNSHAAAFFGSTVKDLPPLGSDFIDYTAALVEAQRHDLKPVDVAKLAEAFQLFGERPQYFMDSLGQALNPLVEDQTICFEDRLLEAARRQEAIDEAQIESEYLGLSPLGRAVLWRILEKGERFRPYDADALAFYQKVTGRKVVAPTVKSAIDTLRQRTPPLVWKSARGEYAADDLAMHRWYQKLSEAGKWPPGEPLVYHPS
ncbi:MAG: AAA family ATPase [Betaproteobacteria bacterium]|nr:AAA family ATPase [Betaproteobacteria bacterium]